MKTDINKFYTSYNTCEFLNSNSDNSNNRIYKDIFDYEIYNNNPNMKIKNGDVVIDIGAHIGIYSRYSSVFGASKIFSFEMNVALYECLKKNIREQDDAFNCLILNKNFTKFKLENEMLVNGFELNHFYYGGLFKNIDFVKIDVMGKEKELLFNIDKKLYNNLDKLSIKCYNMLDSEKNSLIEFMKINGFFKYHNVLLTNQKIQFLYFWK